MEKIDWVDKKGFPPHLAHTNDVLHAMYFKDEDRLVLTELEKFYDDKALMILSPITLKESEFIISKITDFAAV